MSEVSNNPQPADEDDVIEIRMGDGRLAKFRRQSTGTETMSGPIPADQFRETALGTLYSSGIRDILDSYSPFAASLRQIEQQQKAYAESLIRASGIHTIHERMSLFDSSHAIQAMVGAVKVKDALQSVLSAIGPSTYELLSGALVPYGGTPVPAKRERPAPRIVVPANADEPVILPGEWSPIAIRGRPIGSTYWKAEQFANALYEFLFENPGAKQKDFRDKHGIPAATFRRYMVRFGISWEAVIFEIEKQRRR